MKQTLYFLLAVLLFFGHSAKGQIFTPVSLISPTLVTAPNGNLQPGALYKYTNAAGGSGNYIDAYVQIMRKSNTSSDAVGLYAFDNLASVNNPGGYDSAFQPVTSCSSTNTSGLWTPNQQACGNGYVQMKYSANQDYLVHFRLYFKKAGTNQDTALNIRAAFIDIDGFGAGTEAEQNAFMPGVSYAVAPNTTLTFKTRADGLINAEGQPANVAGLQMTAVTAISQVTYLNRTYIDFGMGMNTHQATLNNSCYDAVAGGRLASVSFAGQPIGCTVTTNTTFCLYGTVWDDADGSANGTFSNIQTNSEVGTSGGGLYVYAIDSLSGTVIRKATVAANGTWSMNNVPQGLPIKLVLSRVNVAEGVTNGSPSGALNSGWVATSPLLRPAFRPTGNTYGLDFGIEQPPVGANYTLASQLNPGGTIQVVVPSVAFTGTDAEDGTYPAGLTNRKVTLTPGSNGNLYYNGVAITSATTITSFDPTKVTVDPTGPNPTSQVAVTSTFFYSVYDNANQPSAPMCIILPFEPPILISGYVWDDANGDAVKAPTEPYTNAGGLNAVLTNNNGNVLQVVAVNAATGAYQFDRSISNTTYKVLLSTTSPALGSTFTASSLPAGTIGNWINTGVNLNGIANTGNTSGTITLTTGTTNITNQNFGIEQIPAGANYTAASQLNPGGTTAVPVPVVAFTGVDFEDGTYPNGLSGRKVTLAPGTNGNLYYNGTAVTSATTITNFDPTKVTIDPTGPNPTSQVSVTSTFFYSVYDAANQPSPAMCIILPFEPPIYISGTVWDDANGDAVKAATEPYTNAGGLNAVLTDNNGYVLQVVAVNATTGAYQFNQSISNTTYKVILSTSTPAIGSQLTTSSLPNGVNGPWVNTGVNLNGVANTGNQTAVITVNVQNTPVTNQNFGIEQIPAVANASTPSQLNPGGTVQVHIPGSLLSGNDPEDGTYPTGLNGKKVTLYPGTNGDLYYNGIKVTAATTITAFDSSKLNLDPTGPNPTSQVAVTSTFNYSVYDAAGQPSAQKTVTVPFEPPLPISGYVWDDANADAVKAATEPYTNAGGLNAVLTTTTGQVLQVVAVNGTTGAYSFDKSISNTTYKVVLTTTTPAIGSTLITSSLPNGTYGPWVNTGVNLSGTANTGNKTGIITVAVVNTAVTNQNFGIQQPPTGANSSLTSQRNPGGTIQVHVPGRVLTGNDPEDGTYPTGLNGKKVTLYPGTNGDLYYNGIKVTAATTITAFDSSKLNLDPTGPNPTGYVAVTATFTYSVYDAGNLPSIVKTVTVPFDAQLCIYVRAYLEGALISNSNATAPDGRPLMRDNLRQSPFTNAEYIPKKDIYEFSTPYVEVTGSYTKYAPQNSSFPQFQQVTDSAIVFGITGQNAIVDWAFVELRNKSNNAQVLATRSGLLQRDGDIVETDGVGCLQFPTVPLDSYYVAVRHRSHLGTMTKYAQSVPNLQTLVDLTVPTTPLFDKGVQGQFNFTGLSQKANVVGTYRAMWQGDFNADGKVKYDNPDDDLTNMLFDVLLYPNNGNGSTNYDFAYGYRQGDYDMNSKTKYDNPDDDNAMLLFTELLYPQNANGATNFDFFLQQLP